MTDNFFQVLWYLIREELTLNSEVYTQLAQSSHSGTIALVIVLAAGLSQAVYLEVADSVFTSIRSGLSSV